MSRKRSVSSPETRHKTRSVRKEILVTPKTPGQEVYIDLIKEHDVVLCSGPAGCGKTLLAVGVALQLMQENPNKYKKLVMVRPALVVKGEDMGFLPGDADEKIAPFLLPLMDSLGAFLNQGEIQSLVDSGTIDAIPMAFMRGITLHNSIVILDEAQNTRWEHMKMFLTRIGNNTKAIVEGDIDQSDLDGPLARNNGLKLAMNKLKDVDCVGTINLGEKDVVRSAIVRKLVNYL